MRAQIENTVAETKLRYAQTEQTKVQTNHIKAQIANIKTETTVKQQQMKVMKAQIDNTKAETLLKEAQKNNTNMDTRVKQKQIQTAAIETIYKIAQTKTAQAQTEYLKAQTKAADKDEAVKEAQAASEQMKANLYKRQIEGFDEDFKQKLLKIGLDSWAVGFSVAQDVIVGENKIIPKAMTAATLDALWEEAIAPDVDVNTYDSRNVTFDTTKDPENETVALKKQEPDYKPLQDQFIETHKNDYKKDNNDDDDDDDSGGNG